MSRRTLTRLAARCAAEVLMPAALRVSAFDFPPLGRQILPP